MKPNECAWRKRKQSLGPASPALGMSIINKHSDVVIEVELVRIRAHPNGVHFVLGLVLDPQIDQLLGEHTALEEEFVVRLESRENAVERTGDGWNLGRLLGREIVAVLIERFAGMNLVLDTVESGQEHCRVRQIRITGRVGRAELQPL